LNLESFGLFLANFPIFAGFSFVFFPVFDGPCFAVFVLGSFFGLLFDSCFVEEGLTLDFVVFGDFDVFGDLICFGFLGDIGVFFVTLASLVIFAIVLFIVVVLEVVELVVFDVVVAWEVNSGFPALVDFTVLLLVELARKENAVVASSLSVSSRI
jgi:hypothetical protein